MEGMNSYSCARLATENVIAEVCEADWIAIELTDESTGARKSHEILLSAPITKMLLPVLT